MTDKANPSISRPGKAHETSVAIAEAGGLTPGYVVPGTEVALADEDPDLDETAMNAFAETHSGTSYSVSIDPGEAFVHGAWVARDASTSVTLASSTANQVVYVGWDKTTSNGVIVGLAGDFASDDRKLPLWEFDTDGSGVTAARDLRYLGRVERLADGQRHYFGTDDDMAARFEAANDRLVYEDAINGTDRFAINRSGGLDVIESGTNRAVWHEGNDGAGSGLVSDKLDGFHQADFGLNRRTFGPFAGDSNGRVWKLLEFGDETWGNGITARAVRHTDRNGDEPMGSVYLEADARGTSRNFQHWVTGKKTTGTSGLSSNSNAVHFLVSYDSNSGRHILYVYTPGYADFKVVTESAQPPSVIDVQQVSDDSSTFSPTGTTQYDTANHGPDAPMGFGDTQAKVVNEVVYGAHPDFSTAQAALDFANTNNIETIFFPAGGYGVIKPYANQTIVGVGSATNFDGGTTGHAINLRANGAQDATVKYVQAQTTPGGGNPYDAINCPDNGATNQDENITLSHCYVAGADRHAIATESRGTKIINCTIHSQNVDNSSDIFLGADSSGCIVDSIGQYYTYSTTVTNNGTGNVVGDVV